MLTKEKSNKKEKMLIKRITLNELFPFINTNFTSSYSLIQLRKEKKWSYGWGVV